MRVVHVKSHAFTHYIGRGWMPRAPTGKAQPVNAGLGNPFVMRNEADRQQVISQFEAWLRLDAPNARAVVERIRQLPEDAVLGCWCAPRPCHGDVIVKIWKELRDGSR